VVVDASGRVFVANAGNNSITQYAPEVTGNAAPIARIAGAATRLSQPQDVAVDASGNLFVTNGNASVTEYAPGANGNVAPKARIAGAATGLSHPRGIVIDPASALRVDDANRSVNTYPAGASGNVAPLSSLVVRLTTTQPYGLNFDPNGNLLVADAANAASISFRPASAA
jgi:streptogramin lyase